MTCIGENPRLMKRRCLAENICGTSGESLCCLDCPRMGNVCTVPCRKAELIHTLGGSCWYTTEAT
jgi:hypothetical protein